MNDCRPTSGAGSGGRNAIRLTMDDRERRGPVSELLIKGDEFKLEIRRLPVGDYLLDNELLFERKTLPDLVTSIKEGRLFSQALRLAEAKRPAALLLEGTTGDLAGSGMHWGAIQGALITVALFIGVPVLRSRSAAETIQTFLYAARLRRAVTGSALHRRSRRPKGKAALQRYILQGLPSVGPERAARLLQRFGSVESVFIADAAALADVPGIGSHTAGKLRWAVEEPHHAHWWSEFNRESL